MPPIFSFAGRTSPGGYIVLGGAILIILLAFQMAGAVTLGAAMLEPEARSQASMANGLFTIGRWLAIYLGAAATVRRLRDMGWPVLWGAAGLVGVVLASRTLLLGVEEAVHSIDPVSGLARLAYAPLLILVFWPSAPAEPKAPEAWDADAPQAPSSFGRRGG